MTGPAAGPAGAPRAGSIEGILDGRVADLPRLTQAVNALAGTGAGSFKLDVQGGRFSLLPVETSVAGRTFGEEAQARFLSGLQEVIAAAQPGSVETNLRCRLVYADEVLETLFVVRGDRCEPMTRRRPLTPAEASDLSPAAPQLPLGMRRKEVLWLAPVLLLLGLFVAWQGGWVDRVLAARAEGMRCDTGPFGTMLACTIERSWGNYELTLRRGPAFPANPAEINARKDEAGNDLARATAVGIVGEGRELYLQLLDAAGKVLAEARIDLRPLLAGPEGESQARLPGRMGATGYRLSTTPAPRPK